MKKVLAMVLALLMALAFPAGIAETVEGGYDMASKAATDTIAGADVIQEVTETDMTGFELKEGDWVIGLSNSYYGNTWRKQSVSAFEEAAQSAIDAGYISSYEVQNGDNTVNAQLAQMNTYILENVDAICINAVSTTALNSVIKKANDAGIYNVVYDSLVDSEYAWKIGYDFIQYGETVVDGIAKIAGEDAKIIIVRGVSGSSPDADMYQGNLNALEKYNMEVVATVYGEASAQTTSDAITSVLPSLTQVDGVATQGGGDAYGVVAAFDSSTLDYPVIIGDNSAEFLQWWIDQKAATGYETISLGSTPSISTAALWVSLFLLNGSEVPKEMATAFYVVGQDEVDNYAGMEAGTIVSPVYSAEYVVENIIRPYIAG